MTALPSSRMSELRALDVVDVVPAGHIAVLVRDNRFEPHLHRGEFAIVDTTDKARVYGELYAVTLGGQNGPKLKIVELIKGFAPSDVVCTVDIWFAFSLSRDTNVGGGRRARYVDGPLRFDAWDGVCRGRVVGVMLAV